MRILLLTDGITPFVTGGMQRHSFYLAKFLVQKGAQVVLVHCVPPNTPLPTQEEVYAALEVEPTNSNLEIISLRFPKAGSGPGHYLKESYQYSERIYKLVQDRWSEWDMIYAKGFTAWYFLAKKAKEQASIPPIAVNFHGLEMFQPSIGWKQKLRAWMLRGAVKWNLQNADAVVSYGGKITGILSNLGIEASNILELPTGIAEENICASTSTGNTEKRTFLFMGRYERRKGIEELNAAILERPIMDNVVFKFLGAIPHSKRLKRKDVEYLNEVKELETILQVLDRADVLVVPSHAEGMPNVIMEGLSRGLAVIATDVGAVSLMVDATNGWLIPPGNSVALKESLEKAVAIENRELQTMGLNSIKKVNDSFKWQKIVEDTLVSLSSFAARRKRD